MLLYSVAKIPPLWDKTVYNLSAGANALIKSKEGKGDEKEV
ncbi:MAG: hypothetical protein ACOYJV_03980 [Aminivibrio sp.]|jgi:hypothetical protein